MSELKEKRKRKPYVTYNSRVAEIFALYRRGPTENETRALKTLPLGRAKDWADTTPIGLEIFRVLERSETNRDVSLLEEAGRLLTQRSLTAVEMQPHQVLASKCPRPQRITDLQESSHATECLPRHEAQQQHCGGQIVCSVHSPNTVEWINNENAKSLLGIVNRFGYLPALPEPTSYPSKLVNPRGLQSNVEILQSDSRLFGLCEPTSYPPNLVSPQV